jgi:ADP-ribose pyrophosphatase YjhB (NUDIX family)
MRNFPVKIGDNEYWISRSVSVEGFIFTLDNGIRVLANKRGKGCPNNVGKWNCPCGYLDYDETLKKACCREIKEETNLTVSPSLLNFFTIDSTPKGKSQNISVSYWSYRPGYAGQTITGEAAEPDEVDDVEWISLDELDKYDWAFEHNYTIMKVSLMYLRPILSDETIRRFSNKLKERNLLETNA